MTDILSPEEIAIRKLAGKHFRATSEGEVQFTDQEETDWAAEVSARENAPLVIPPEIAMHKVRKALKQLGPSGAITPETYDDSWWMRTLAVIDSLTNPIQRDSIMDELNTAPNIVLAGATTQMVRTAVGMSDEQLDAVAVLALTLP